MKLVIDADQMIFSCGFATEGEPLGHALHLVRQKIDSLIHKSDATDVEVYVKGKGNFREALVSNYKANRDSKKPKHYDGIYKYLLDKYNAIPVDGKEVDDEVSSVLWKDYIKHGGESFDCEVVLFSADKDLLNTPGWHLNLKSEEPFWVSEDSANRHFWKQMLMGDAVDNIKGLPSIPNSVRTKYGLRTNKVGAATAERLMQDVATDDLPDFVYSLYYCSVPGPLYFLTQMELLWMERYAGEHPADYFFMPGDTRPTYNHEITHDELEAAWDRVEEFKGVYTGGSEFDMSSMPDPHIATRGSAGSRPSDGEDTEGPSPEL